MRTIFRHACAAAVVALSVMTLSGCGPSAFWSPDSQALALDLDGRLRIFDLGAHRFTTLDTGGRYVVNPTYSLDGAKLAYYAITRRGSRATACEIWVRDLAANTERKLIASRLAPPAMASVSESAVNLKVVRPLAWNPDGRRLAHARDRGDVGEIEIVDLTGGTPTSLGRPGEAQFAPSWSPDGRRIAYIAEVDSARRGQESSLSVYVADADGAQRQRVWDGNRDAELWPYAPPAWTADGSAILVFCQRKGEEAAEARVVPVSGGESRLLALFETPLGMAARDLRSIVFAGRDRDEAAILYKVAPFTQARVLDHLPEEEPAPNGETPFTPFPVLSPDGRRVALPLRWPRQELRLYDLATGERSRYALPETGVRTLHTPHTSLLSCSPLLSAGADHR